MIKINRAHMLKDVLQGTGFVRRGAAFFRVWGDGVLQVLKFEREPSNRVPDLHVGVFSMYGKLRPEWFTSFGCIPRGSIAGFIGLRYVDGHLSPKCLTKAGDGQFFYEGFPVSIDSNEWMGDCCRYYFTPEQQAHILEKKALPWLSDITNQSLAAKAMYEICPVSNDSLRFDAHLAAGEWTQAEQIMAAIMKQHADAQKSWERTFPQDKYAKMVAEAEVIDAPLKAAHKMVQEKDEAAIENYLKGNYKRNCVLAKFCMK